MESFKTERLSDSVSVVVTKEHTFGTDAVLLADFAKVKKSDKPIDLGTGCGIIPLLWCTKPNLSQEIHCLDIQENAVEQVNKSIEINFLQEKLFVHHLDLKNCRSAFQTESFSVVTMNPPYKPIATGIESTSQSDKIARHETMCNLDDLASNAKYLLKYGGRLCICHRPERLADVICAFRNNKIEPKRLRFVVDKNGEEPFLFLLEARKGGKSGMRVEPLLNIKNSDGKFTKEMLKIYGDYGEGYHL